MLPDKGSNLDIQIQNLSYYHYTIGQSDGPSRLKSDGKYRGFLALFAKISWSPGSKYEVLGLDLLLYPRRRPAPAKPGAYRPRIPIPHAEHAGHPSPNLRHS